MIESLVGMISGIVSGTGMGGGTILILVLSLFMGIQQHIAQATNIVFFVPTSIVAIIVSIKQKMIDFKVGSIIVITGVIGAAVGAKLAQTIDDQNLKKYFGVFLGMIAIYEIYTFAKQYILKRKTHNSNISKEKEEK